MDIWRQNIWKVSWTMYYGQDNDIFVEYEKKCYHSYNVLSATVKDCFVKVTQQNFHSAKMRLEISHDGNKGIREFWYAYCNIW